MGNLAYTCIPKKMRVPLAPLLHVTFITGSTWIEPDKRVCICAINLELVPVQTT